MKVMVECDGAMGTSESDGVVQLSDALELFEQALRGCGFCFNGHIEIVEDE